MNDIAVMAGTLSLCPPYALNPRSGKSTSELSSWHRRIYGKDNFAMEACEQQDGLLRDRKARRVRMAAGLDPRIDPAEVASRPNVLGFRWQLLSAFHDAQRCLFERFSTFGKLKRRVVPVLVQYEKGRIEMRDQVVKPAWVTNIQVNVEKRG
jgi:hypothetical protein